MGSLDRRNHRGVIYAVRGLESGNIKIGHSVCLESRLRQLRYDAGENIELLGVSGRASRSQEYWIHHNLADSSEGERGEWYHPTPDVMCIVNRMDGRAKEPKEKTQHLPDRLLDVEEAAEFLGLTEKALRRRVERDVIPYRKVGRLLRFDPHELYRWSDPNAGD